MKIEIITRHSMANYGSILQSYATQKVIEKLGHDSEIIDYVRKDEKGNNIAETMLKRNNAWNKNKIKRFIYKCMQTPVYSYSYKKFKNYRDHILKQTQIEYDSKQMLINQLPEGDIYCTGSDQVWGKIGCDDYDDVYFLEFVPEGKRCISYAASFGKDEISEDLEKNLRQYLKKYNSLTVRENNAVNIVKKHGKDCRKTLDPTLLLNKDEWNQFIESDEKTKGEYILVYQLHNNDEFEKYVENFSKKEKLNLKRISISWLYAFKSGNLEFLPSPQKFLKLIRDAKYIVTDSFHGTVFSILFEKKFMDILPKGTGDRIFTILKELEIENRVLQEFSDYETIKKEIDYEKVTKKLREKREESIDILKRMIEE